MSPAGRRLRPDEIMDRDIFPHPLPSSLPQFVHDAVHELERYRYTAGLRELITTHLFTEKEIRHIVTEATKNYPLKKSEEAALAAGGHL